MTDVPKPEAITPTERVGELYVKRDDLCIIHGARGGKARTCYALAHASAGRGLVTAGSRSSPQVLLVATMAKALGVPCVVHVPGGDITTGPVAQAGALGAKVIQHTPGYNTVIVARSREYADEHGMAVIPFGMECEAAVEQTRRQVVNMPSGVRRVVIPVGSGMSLAGVLWGMADNATSVPVLGVVVGADPAKRLDKYAPPDWRNRVVLVMSGVPYNQAISATLGDIDLDPIYEAKCHEHLREGDLFWIVGHRDPLQEPETKPGFCLFGRDLFGNPIQPEQSRGELAKRFTLPPFSVLNAREGAWQERKRAWLGCGIQSEVGRKALAYTTQTLLSDGTPMSTSTGVSVFDPVLCELMYTWFCPLAGHVVDPFAGGSVRGVVASLCDRMYWGCDLSAKQIEANEVQAAEICDGGPMPVWVNGDSATMLDDAPTADFVFSCPPYGSLEVYSDDPHDLSSMTPAGFQEAYSAIIAKAVGRLRGDRFAAFVVGNYRDKRGRLVDLVGQTVAAFEAAGAMYYNEIVLVTSAGSLPIRVTKQFDVSRKIGKTHQNVLVFVKGDPRRAAQVAGRGTYGDTTV